MVKNHQRLSKLNPLKTGGSHLTAIKIQNKMKKAIPILIILTIFSSCYTAKKAQMQVHKANLEYPLVTTDFCAIKFPIKEKLVEKIKFISGETIVKTDTLKIDCDSVVSDKNKDNKVLIKYKNIYQRDTILKTITIEKENTARVVNLQIKIEDLNLINKENEKIIKDNNTLIEDLWYFIFCSVFLNVIFIIFIVRNR